MASVLFALYGWIVRGVILPLDAGGAAWGWLAVSGLVGFVLGDLFLFQAFVDIGARISMLVFSSVPPLTAIMAWIALGETLSPVAIGGMVLTVSGIVVVVLKRPSPPSETETAADTGRHPDHPIPSTRTRVKGVLMAFGGALGQSGGIILGRIGAGVEMDAFAASQIRALADRHPPGGAGDEAVGQGDHGGTVRSEGGG